MNKKVNLEKILSLKDNESDVILVFGEGNLGEGDLGEGNLGLKENEV